MYSRYFCLLVLLGSQIDLSIQSCHNIHDKYHTYLGTKTGYRWIQNENSDAISYSDCELSKIWGIIRHGTRLPGDDTISKMQLKLTSMQQNIIDNFNSDKSSLCNISKFTAWQLKLHNDLVEKSLTEEGGEELFKLGVRMRDRFPSLLKQKYDNDTFKFKYTPTQRTQESAFQFVEGLFGREDSVEVAYEESQKRDPILRFYKACDKWRETVDKNPEAYEEQQKFEQSKLFQEMVEQVSKRLGFEEKISSDDIKLMYTTCGFETAWFPNEVSPWCTIFTEKDLQILEYNEDLEYYWIDGHGFSLTEYIACVAFKDMYHTLSSKSKHDVVFYFTHSGTVLKILAHLKIYNDSVSPRHDNFHQMSNRKWRVSKIDAFGTNLVFAKFKCKNEDYVLAQHQETPIILSGCTQELCPLKTIEKAYEESLTNCNFEEQCRFDGESRQKIRDDESLDHDEL